MYIVGQNGGFFLQVKGNIICYVIHSYLNGLDIYIFSLPMIPLRINVKNIMSRKYAMTIFWDTKCYDATILAKGA